MLQDRHHCLQAVAGDRGDRRDLAASFRQARDRGVAEVAELQRRRVDRRACVAGDREGRLLLRDRVAHLGEVAPQRLHGVLRPVAVPERQAALNSSGFAPPE